MALRLGTHLALKETAKDLFKVVYHSSLPAAAYKVPGALPHPRNWVSPVFSVLAVQWVGNQSSSWFSFPSLRTDDVESWILWLLAYFFKKSLLKYFVHFNYFVFFVIYLFVFVIETVLSYYMCLKYIFTWWLA